MDIILLEKIDNVGGVEWVDESVDRAVLPIDPVPIMVCVEVVDGPSHGCVRVDDRAVAPVVIRVDRQILNGSGRVTAKETVGSGHESVSVEIHVKRAQLGRSCPIAGTVRPSRTVC